MKLSEILIMHEDDLVSAYEKLSSEAASYVPYMFIDARLAEDEDIGQHLTRIIPGPAINDKMRVSKGDYVARVIQTGTYEYPNPIQHLFALDKQTFDLFTMLDGREADVEGFLPYESEGEEIEAVKDGSYFICKRDRELTKLPASIFKKQFRPSGD